MWFMPVLLLAWMVMSSYTDYRNDERLAQEGRIAQGVVTGKTTARSSGRRGGTTHYLVNFRFAVTSGAAVDGQAQFGAEAWERINDGDPLNVRYVPEEPAINRPEGHPPVFTASGAAISVLLGLFLLGAGLYNRSKM